MWALNHDTFISIMKSVTPTDSHFVSFDLHVEKDRKRPDASPLTTLKHASQVCRSWRESILYTSSLWGDAISLDHLNQVSHYWREEVLKRTGTSPLSIIGRKVGGNSPAFKFFLRLQTNHGERIRRVSISIIYGKGFPIETRWPKPTNHSSVLEILNICLLSHMGIIEDRMGDMAPNFAPKLHALVLGRAKLNLPNLHTPNLQQLDIRHCTVFNGFLGFMKQLPHLEALTLDCVALRDTENPSEDHQPVEMLKLKSLRITGVRYEHTFFLLRHIIPAPGAVVEISTVLGDSTRQLLDSQLQLACYLTAHLTTNMFLKISSDVLIVSSSRIGSPFLMEIHYRPTIFERVLSALVDCLPGIFLTNVESLHIAFKNKVYYSATKQHIHKIFLSLASVETVHIDCDGLMCFSHLITTEKAPGMFPRMHTVVLSAGDSPVPAWMIMAFMVEIRSAGCPLSRICVKNPVVYYGLVAANERFEDDKAFSIVLLNHQRKSL